MKAPVTRVVAHPLTGAAMHPIDGNLGTPFDTATYSLMKHGDLPSIRDLGNELANALLKDCPWLSTTGSPIVLPVAYLVAKPACFYLASAVCDVLNEARGERAPARVIHVHKDSVTHIDYAASSAQDRRNDLASIGFRLTDPVRDAIAIVIDDVRVTGLAEQVMVDLLQDNGIGQIVTAYVATCDEQLAADPSVESALNHAVVRSIHDMLPSVQRGDFVPTIRFLKRLLADPDAAGFLAACPAELVQRFRADAEATGERFLAGYPAGTAALFAESDLRSSATREGVGQ
ncbi:phosphoribosyltransferase family protein [Flexivirga alba]|uniref:Phosphoribosyltransferase family protein n=1 Tax=Flexivirga alba TaxID=702742 RepID=A0ABW2ADJ6_9MICO